MQANFFLQNMENSGSLHGNVLEDYNAASTNSVKTENISTSSPLRSLSFHVDIPQVSSICNHQGGSLWGGPNSLCLWDLTL